MKITIATFASCFGLCILSLPSRSEVETTIEAKGSITMYVNEAKSIPLLICVQDEKKAPIKNAIVALKRIQAGGWTEKEIRDSAESKTNSEGLIALSYLLKQGLQCKSDDDKQILIGALTVIAEGYPIQVFELDKLRKADEFKSISGYAPYLEVTLTAEQAATSNGDKPPN